MADVEECRYGDVFGPDKVPLPTTNNHGLNVAATEDSLRRFHHPNALHSSINSRISVTTMGFTTGLTGGVTATLGLAYLAIYTHQRNREYQSEILRSQTRVLDSLLEPVVPIPPPRRAEIEAARRANLVDTAKDRWNSEVANAVNWVQRTDWTEVREGLEEGVGTAWRTVFGGEPSQQAAAVVERVVTTGEEAKGAWERAREKTLAAAEARAAEARVGAAKRVEELQKAGERTATEVREAAAEAVDTGIEKGEALLNGAAEAMSAQVSGAADPALTSVSPVEKALQQRYEARPRVEKKNVLSAASIVGEGVGRRISQSSGIFGYPPVFGSWCLVATENPKLIDSTHFCSSASNLWQSLAINSITRSLIFDQTHNFLDG
ncbi:hypothetical protein SODALDRAFT_381793 [Sodiomyces alkalinus F11]|uniref:MICOS complex subunit MIC12 n=1 Tax=Sodiomyces alkalinus (strain CBS 110278 / VKM F-3762 / F11) TaxID=1314773 RepID=A0A3N2PMK4_SODAK|nr:hypothetical protein SODALDRAFT_381793 [Sodiomyces alkalinus F11]ROT35644.1 hypothetical protein SODALDRAFT_381793 [Sodiomyces alkalinus F11]